ncbi:MAG: alpha/beta hydrolase [Eubacterium sp.]|nr:alpha/beta hydrolase [Eubacterium sp.]
MIEYITLHNKKQCVSIKTNKKGAPVLLYLHGGPGDTALPLVSKYNKELENDFTVVVWEQPGAGKSYFPFTEEANICIANFVDDLEQLCQWLLTRFKQEKLYLVAHSWGSVLGLKFVTRCPQYLHQYIGCGQVVNMAKSSRKAKEFAIQKNMEAENSKIVEKLKSIDCSYIGENWLDNLLFVTGQVVKQGGSLYGKRSYNRFIMDFLFSREYTLRDLLNRQKGSLPSIQFLWQELMLTDFEQITRYHVPVTFIEGRFDNHVSSELVEQYYHSLTTPKAFHWFENSAHFPQWSEPARFNHLLYTMVQHER